MRSYRRRQQQKKMNITIGFTVLLAIILIIMFSRMMSTTISGSLDIDKEYYSVMIQQDDTLWDIAEKFVNTEYQTTSEFVQTIIDMNELSSDTIYPGEYLTVPLITVNH